MNFMILLAVIGILLLQWTGSISPSSVGGPLTIALAYFGAALAIGVHEAWTRGRGVVGWIVNLLATVIGAFVAAQLGGLVVIIFLGAIGTVDGSLAKSAGPLLSVALAGGMVATILGAQGALHIVNRWR